MNKTINNKIFYKENGDEEKEKELLSGDDIGNQDDFEVWQEFCQ